MLSSCVYWLRNKINFEFLSSCHHCQFPTKLINGWVSVHETRFPKYNLFFFLHFWIGSYLWSIEGQALRWHHYSHNFAFFINNKNSMLLRVCRIRHHRRQNVVRTSLTFSSHVPLFFLTIFWSHLWSITEQTDDNIESTCWAERKFGLWTLLNYLFHPSRHMSVEYEQ